MTVSTTRKLISCTVCEYRLLQLEIEHYSFLLEFVEFFDEMKTPEIKKNMELCHHKYHLSNKKVDSRDAKNWVAVVDIWTFPGYTDINGGKDIAILTLGSDVRANGHAGELMTVSDAKWSLVGHSRSLN